MLFQDLTDTEIYEFRKLIEMDNEIKELMEKSIERRNKLIKSLKVSYGGYLYLRRKIKERYFNSWQIINYLVCLIYEKTK